MIYGKIGLIIFLECVYVFVYWSKWELKVLNGGDEGLLLYK